MAIRRTALDPALPLNTPVAARLIAEAGDPRVEEAEVTAAPARQRAAECRDGGRLDLDPDDPSFLKRCRRAESLGQ